MLDEPLEPDATIPETRPKARGKPKAERENGHRKHNGEDLLRWTGERLVNSHSRRLHKLDSSHGEYSSGNSEPEYQTRENLEPENGQRRRPREPDADRRRRDGWRKRSGSEEKQPMTSWVRVDNIPPVAEEKHFHHLFSSNSNKVLTCLVKAGSAFVHFDKAESAVQTAKQFDGGELGGRVIAVQLEFSPPQRSPERYDTSETEQAADACKSEKRHKKERRARH